jgi:hypothetical protein
MIPFHGKMIYYEETKYIQKLNSRSEWWSSQSTPNPRQLPPFKYTKFFHILFCYIFDTGLKKAYMRYFFLLVGIAGFLASCSRSPGTGNVNSPEAGLKDQAVALAEAYAKDQQNKIVISPDLVFTGLIDEDELQDAIVSVSTF